MSLTRKFLSAMGIEADKIDEIIAAHTETVNALKEQRDMYKADSDKLPDIQKELDDLKKASSKGDSWKVKYEALKEDFDDYKAKETEKETRAKKQAAVEDLLKKIGVSEKRIKSVLKVTDLDELELDGDNLKDSETLKTSLEEEWSDFIEKENSQGANTSTPPAGNGKTFKSMDEIMAITDAGARQQAIAENHELFGF